MSFKHRNHSEEKRSDRQHSIVARVILAGVLCFLALSIFIAYSSYTSYVQLHKEYFSTLSMEINEKATLAVDGDQIAHYIETLTPDENYGKLVQIMDRVRDNPDVKYIYIMADTGVPGEYTYIYDSESEDEGISGLGLTEGKDVFDGGDEVLATGKGFAGAEYYIDDQYGELYYSYAPITDSNGNVVAFAGTDINIEPMQKDILRYQHILIFITAGTTNCLCIDLLFPAAAYSFRTADSNYRERKVAGSG